MNIFPTDTSSSEGALCIYDTIAKRVVCIIETYYGYRVEVSMTEDSIEERLSSWGETHTSMVDDKDYTLWETDDSRYVGMWMPA